MDEIGQIISSPTKSSIHLASSPQLPSSNYGSSKVRRPPTVTPRRFNRFFHPSSSIISTPSTSGRQLRDITASSINRQLPQYRSNLVEWEDLEYSRPTKRKKTAPNDHEFKKIVRYAYESPSDDDTLPTYNSSPPRSSPCPQPSPRAICRTKTFENLAIAYCPLRTARIKRAQLHFQPRPRGCTSNFCSGPEDRISFSSPNALPFCTTACNTNSLVCVSTERGTVYVLETDQDAKESFKKPILILSPHENAIMDMAFSSDDRLLGTASGDQTARITDMRTQKELFTLRAHRSTVKQIAFQPGNDNVVVTTGRDGNIVIWDLRASRAAAKLRVLDEDSPRNATVQTFIDSAHQSDPLGSVNPTIQTRIDCSITSLSFLPGDRSHLFLTASDMNSSIKLWDIRAGNPNRRNKTSIPLSTTAPLQSHERYRNFGINSLVMNSDASRLFSLCKDNTVYAYSTNHLILGMAPELSTNPHDRATAARRPRWAHGQQGAIPLYGMRHHQLHTGSFYVRAGLRKASTDSEHPEILAIGSSDHCPILMPIDERFLTKRWSRPVSVTSDVVESTTGKIHNTRSHRSDASTPPSEPPAMSTLKSSTKSKSAVRLIDTIPIYDNGTPLVRGHTKEVTSLTWTSKGELVTVGDDFSARVWREGTVKSGDGSDAKLGARDLRLCGEGGGRRWGCGWAEESEDDGTDDDEG